MDLNAQPPESIPPAYWKDMPGRQAKEPLFPKVHVTSYLDVSILLRRTLDVTEFLSFSRAVFGCV